jgi:hypothetical protein
MATILGPSYAPDRPWDAQGIGPNSRAWELLTRHLTDEQRESCLESGFILVTGASGAVYRIHRFSVELMQAPRGIRWRLKAHTVHRIHRVSGGSFEAIGVFCYGPADVYLPYWDRVLGLKLIIETDEKKFLREAVFTRFH